MARKLFISFLGTGFYEKCTYCDGTSSYTPTRYIQQATLEHIGVDSWTEHDAVRIFVTDKAYTENWDRDNDTRFNARTKAEEPYVRLGKILDGMGIEADVAPVLHVPVGNDESEMWRIFQLVFNEIHEGDELYIDLTHAFRYLPMLVLVLSNYSKFLKHTTVQQLSYGNYEARDDQNHAPIVNLLPLTDLQDWTTAAADFLQNGYIDKMCDLAQGSIRLLQKNEATRNDDNKRLANFVNTLKALVEERQTCRGLGINSGATLRDLQEQAGKIGNVVIKPLEPILDKIAQTLPKPKSSLDNCLDAARWCYNNHLYQQAATILQEGVVTFFCERHGIDIASEDERGLVNSAFLIKFKALPQSRWVVAPDRKEKLMELLDDPLLSQPVAYNTFNNITEIRNDYNHAGFRSKREPQIPRNIKKNIGKALASFGECLTSDYEATVRDRRVFVNLSNHPSAQWSQEQKTAALIYGEIVDVPFPPVPPSCSEKEIEELARKTIGAVMQAAYPASQVTVHAMGEMTLTYRVVSQLKARGMCCVASTSQRVANDLGDGEKLSQFHFVEFRKY